MDRIKHYTQSNIGYIEAYIRKEITYGEVIKKLQNEGNSIKNQIAIDPLMPKEILIYLGQNEDNPVVHRSLARNANAPEELLVFLAHFNNVFLKEDVIMNPNTPDFVLEVLSEDDNPFVRYYAKKEINKRKK